jgi:transposase-like protein
MAPLCYRRHRFPPELIQLAIWLYLRFTLSYRDVEELLAERGLDISYETVRRWVLKFGPVIARRLRRCRPRPSNRWHLDEMVVRIADKRMYLWRAVDHEGEFLDMLIQRRRDTRSALRLMRKLLKKQGFAPKLLVPTNCAPTLRRCAVSVWPVRMSRGPQEQQGGEFASGSATTRAQAAAVQVASICPALCQHERCGSQHLQPATPPHLPKSSEPRQFIGIGAPDHVLAH